MRVFGNLMNRIGENVTAPPVIEVGMGATIFMWSDRLPATVIAVSHKGKRVVLQEDAATRVDSNGMSEVQSYSFSPNPNGRTFNASLRKNGTWKSGTDGVRLGARAKYHDFSF